MRKIPYYLAVTIVLQFIKMSAVHAQNLVSLNLKAPAKSIIVDGDISEWGDSLSYYSPEERLNYAITNTKDTLYLAVKIYEKSEIARVLNAGLTLTLDPKGKKKATYSVTFPLNMQGGAPMLFNHKAEGGGDEDDVTKEDRDELMRERITTLRGIKVIGFKDVEDEMISTSNTYGFLTAVNYDDAGNLICEAAIPLKYLHADDAMKSQWSFNLKINGVQRPAPSGDGNNSEGGSHGGGGGMGGGGGGGMGGGGGRHGGGGGKRGGGGGANPVNLGEIAKTIDFWGKFYLAK